MKKSKIWAAAMTVCAAVVLSAAPPSPAVPMDVKKLESMAKSAKSATEHKEVATQYTDRALFFETKAKQHDAEVERLTNSRNYNPMAAKWPAVANAPVDYHKRAAMQARRAAEESRQVAATHLEKAGQSRASE